MPLTNQYDAIDVLTEVIPYQPSAKVTEGAKHLRSGSSNLWTTTGLELAKRPGFSTFGSDLFANSRIVWVTVSEAGTLAASVYNETSGDYYVAYRKTGGSWTVIGSVQGINSSVDPHEMVWVGKELYIRGTPNSNVLGAVVFNEIALTTVAWGAYTPTSISLAAPVFTASGGWNSSSSDTVVPLLGARYAYTFTWTSGQESSRSAFSDKSPIVSGKYPAMTLPNPLNSNYGSSITHINIYRSADGGGALWFLESLEIGVDTPDPSVSSTFVYEDTNFIPGGNFSSTLNFSRPCPTLTSNDPPPTIEEGVVLTDYPPERSSPIAYFRGRLFFAVGRNLYYSVNDEAIPASGLLFHSFRSGSYSKANLAAMPDDVVDLHATQDALFVATKRDIFQVTGELRAELRIRLAYPGIGVYDRRCMTSIASMLFWLDQNRELRSAVPGGALPVILSGVLKQEHIIASRRYSIHRIYYQEHVWIVVAIVDTSDPDNTLLYVYDAARQFWFPPWSVSCDAIWDFMTIAKGTAIGQMDRTVGTDLSVNFGCSAYFGGFRVPGGNHINLLRAHATLSILQYLELYWSGAQPTVTVRRDSLTTALTTTVSNPPTSPEPVGYSRGFFYLDEEGQPGDRFFPIVVVASSSALWALWGLALVFEPTMGD